MQGSFLDSCIGLKKSFLQFAPARKVLNIFQELQFKSSYADILQQISNGNILLLGQSRHHIEDIHLCKF